MQSTFEMKKFPEKGFLRQKDILVFIPISKSALWKWVSDGRFPKPIKLTSKTTVWRSQDVLNWIEEKSN